MPNTGERVDPYAAFNFTVEIDGVTTAGFTEASGLDSEQEVIDYRTGERDTIVTKLPGLRKHPAIVLKRGFTASDELWQWRKAVMDGQTQRRSGSIVLQNEARRPALRWNFREGWPSKLQGPTLNAKTNDVAIETMEIQHEGLEEVVVA
jgi:phage tail-like protein